MSSSDVKSAVDEAKRTVIYQMDVLFRLSDFVNHIGDAIFYLVEATAHSSDASKKKKIDRIITELESLLPHQEGVSPEPMVDLSTVRKSGKTTPPQPKEASASRGIGLVILDTSQAPPDPKSVNTVSASFPDKDDAEKPVIKKIKRYDVQPNMRALVRTILTMKQFPETFEEVLEKTFGPEWKTRNHSRVGGASRVVPYGEEIYEEDSHVRMQLRGSIEKVFAYLDGKTPDGWQATETLRSISTLVRGRKFATINSHLKEWGI